MQNQRRLMPKIYLPANVYWDSKKATDWVGKEILGKGTARLHYGCGLCIDRMCGSNSTLQVWRDPRSSMYLKLRAYRKYSIKLMLAWGTCCRFSPSPLLIENAKLTVGRIDCCRQLLVLAYYSRTQKYLR